MTKKFSKILLTMLLVVVTVSSFSMCMATEEQINNTTTNTTTDTTNTTTTDTTSTSEEQEIYSGDLYLFDNNVVMDKLVDGNVFIFGSNVEITGQVNGNLFVCANKINFNESYIRYAIFACANSIYYNGACNDLYVATNHLEMTWDSYVVRDVKAVASNVLFKAAIGRDVDLVCNNVTFGEPESLPIIYGNLRYSAAKEATIEEGVINGNGTATYHSLATTGRSVTDILVGFLTCIITILVIYLLVNKWMPNLNKKLASEKLSVLKVLKYLGLGLLTSIVVGIVSIILLNIIIGFNLALILLIVLALLYFVATPALTIVITNALKPALKIEKTPMFCLILILVSIVLYGITFIPWVGALFSILIKLIGLGILIDLVLPKKELTAEQIAAIEEAKKQSKAMKAKKKEEKLKAKEAKKSEKNKKIGH